MSENKCLRINMLGEFTLTYGDKVVTDQINRSKKVWTLLEYLIAFRDREISQNEIIELLWPEDDIDNPSNTLKTLLHRVRSLLDELECCDSKAMIAYRRGTYSWSPEVECVIDTEVFEALCQEADAPDISDEERAEKLFAALNVYKGDFLPKNALETWAVPLTSYYHSLYIRKVRETVELFRKLGRSDDIAALCQKAVVIDPYEEYFHYALIQILTETGRQQQALAHYDFVKDLYFNKFGITPSKELTALYTEIIKTSKTTELDLNVIKEGLEEHDRKSGCFYCEYEFFKNVYQLEARSASRTGQAVYVCLLTVADARGNKPEQKVLNRSMERLYNTISSSLRRGDVFTRYSVSQYLIMLSATNFENGDMVMQRILTTFRRENPKSPVILHYSLLPLTPAMD